MISDQILQHMEVIGADGVHIGTVDGVVDGRIRLAKRDSGQGHHIRTAGGGHGDGGHLRGDGHGAS